MAEPEEAWIDLFKLKKDKSYSIQLPIGDKVKTFYLGKLKSIEQRRFFNRFDRPIPHFAYVFECPDTTRRSKYLFRKLTHAYLNDFLTLYFMYCHRLAIILNMSDLSNLDLNVEDVIRKNIYIKDIFFSEDIFGDNKVRENIFFHEELKEKQQLVPLYERPGMTTLPARQAIYDYNKLIGILGLLIPILKFIVEQNFKIFKEENDPKECNRSDINTLLIALSGEGKLEGEKIVKNNVTYNNVPRQYSNDGVETLSYHELIGRKIGYMFRFIHFLKYKPNETIQNSESVEEEDIHENIDNPYGVKESSSNYGGKKSRKNKKSKSRRMKKSKKNKSKSRT